MKLLKSLVFILWLLGSFYFLYINIFYTSLSSQDLDTINYSNKVLENEIRYPKKNLSIVRKIKHVVSSSGNRSKDVKVVSAASFAYSLFSKSEIYLDSVEQVNSYLDYENDSLIRLESILTSVRDSLRKDWSPIPIITAPNILLTRFNLLFSSSKSDYKTLLNTSITIKRHYLSDLGFSILAHLSNKVSDDCCFCSNRIKIIVIPFPKELEDQKDYEADIYLASVRPRSRYCGMALDYGQGINEVNCCYDPIQFIAQSNSPNKPSLKKWRATIETQDTTFTIETNYTVKPKRE